MVQSALRGGEQAAGVDFPTLIFAPVSTDGCLVTGGFGLLLLLRQYSTELARPRPVWLGRKTSPE